MTLKRSSPLIPLRMLMLGGGASAPFTECDAVIMNGSERARAYVMDTCVT